MRDNSMWTRGAVVLRALPLAAVPVAALAVIAVTPVHQAWAEGGNWAGTVKQSASGATSGGKKVMTPEQVETVKTVNRYFNGIKNMAGRFTQTNPDKSVQRGKFFLARPGRFRFDYNRPSRQVIISDGTYLAIQDLDLNSDDVHSLENTPFRILLRDDVNLMRDARILAVEQSDTQLAVTITDKSPDSPGQITIYMTPKPVAELAGWVTTDVQGGVTKVEVNSLERPEQLDAKLFIRHKLFMKSIR